LKFLKSIYSIMKFEPISKLERPDKLESQKLPATPEAREKPEVFEGDNTAEKSKSREETKIEKSPEEIREEFGNELLEKYGREKLGSIANSTESGMFPCEIKGKVLEVIEPKDWVSYLRFARANYEMKKGEEFQKREGHPHVLHPKERSHERPEVKVADASLRSQLENNWPYEDFSFAQWEANGFLINKEGRPSKLERKFYELVRTDEFKTWFGDWEEENNGEVSKMVDKDTGEPQAFYRGDKSLFKDGFLVKEDEARTPDLNKWKKEKGIYGLEGKKIQSRHQGVFFTDNKKVALEYGKDFRAATLGKFGLDFQEDHPETFPKLKKAMESFADENPLFWKEIFDHRLNSIDVSEEKRKSRFEDFCRRVGLESEDRDDLWNEINMGRRIKDPSHYMDALVRAGVFEKIVNSFEEVSIAKDTGRETNALKRSPLLTNLRRLIREYKTEPLAFSTVFIRSLNPKRARWIDVDESHEIYQARMDGHDAFIHEGGVGKRVQGIEAADEIVVFALKDIWVAEKKSLAKEAIKEDSVL
jgi:hypothetical protein